MHQLNRHQLNQHKSHPVNQRWGSGKHPRCEGCQSWPEVDPHSPTPFQFGESQTMEAPSERRKGWVGTHIRKGDDRRERGSSVMGRGDLPCGARDARVQVLAGTGVSLHWRSSTGSPWTLDCDVPCASASCLSQASPPSLGSALRRSSLPWTGSSSSGVLCGVDLSWQAA